MHFMRNMMKHIPRKYWSAIGMVKQAYLMLNGMEKAADMFDRWHSSL